MPERLVFRTRSPPPPRLARRARRRRLRLDGGVGDLQRDDGGDPRRRAALIDVRFVAFSTEVVDLTDRVDDPLALLLEVSVGGGTHIAAGAALRAQPVTVPQRTLVLVVSDFEEGYSIGGLVGEVRDLVESGVTCLGLAALDDRGAPRYAVPIAEQVAAAGMPVAALTPLELARWIGERIR